MQIASKFSDFYLGLWYTTSYVVDLSIFTRYIFPFIWFCVFILGQILNWVIIVEVQIEPNMRWRCSVGWLICFCSFRTTYIWFICLYLTLYFALFDNIPIMFQVVKIKFLHNVVQISPFRVDMIFFFIVCSIYFLKETFSCCKSSNPLIHRTMSRLTPSLLSGTKVYSRLPFLSLVLGLGSGWNWDWN